MTYAELQNQLEEADQPSAAAFAQKLEWAIALSGPSLIERLRQDPQASERISAELQSHAASQTKRERIAQGMIDLGAVMRKVVHSGASDYEAFALDLYRAFAVPQSARQRALLLNRIAMEYPELSGADLQKQTARFANRMMSFGYRPEDAEDLCATALMLAPHWQADTEAKAAIEELHDKALDAVLAARIAASARKGPTTPARLGVASPAEVLRGLVEDFGFTDQMLGKLSRDLARYHVLADVDERARIDAFYARILAPRDGELGTTAMTQASQHLIGAIHHRLKDAPSDIGPQVLQALAGLTAQATSLEDHLHLLAYFWRAGYPGEPSARAVEVRRQLDALKAGLCAGASGELDSGLAAEFNNAVREALASSLSQRLPGFGTAYAQALAANAGNYEQLVARMGELISNWTVSADAL